VDAFVWIVVGGMAALIIALLLIGRYYPGTGAEVLDWKPTRSVEAEAELELTDIDQMLEAQNERRLRRGEPARTIEDFEGEVAAHLRDQTRRQEAYLARQRAETKPEAEHDPEDLEQLLALHNERRRRRGEPELSADELRAQLQAGPQG
jgi:hypothetical protein